ncbi:prepilin peptidase [Companilactobacillus sp. RD055328]|uniref:prepilin peptidase n=1 Tax=Companilactobacillus sp. RD055328 TaxID=2916634 RepID=UPI0035CF7D5C
MKIIYITILFVLGSCFGSFINLLGMRIPMKQSIIYPRSHCDSCKKNLTWYELLPIVGYLINLGKCRHCKTTISRYLPLNELILGASFTFIFINKIDGLFRIVLLMFLLLFATMDYFYGIILPIFLIPNFVILFLLHPQISLLNCFIFLICLSCFSYISKGFGFGDVEILSFLALFLPLYDCLLIILISCLLCLLVELVKQNFDYAIHFIPYIYLATTLILIFCK